MDKSQLISIAAIHATLLAIIMACLSAYVLYVYNNSQNFELRAIYEAEKINQIKFLRYHHGVYKGDVWNKKKMVDMIADIMARPFESNQQKDIVIIAQELLGAMTALTNQYPFTNRYFKTKEGQFGSKGVPDPILFGNIEDVRKWAKEVDDVTRPLVALWDTQFSRKIIAILEEYMKTDIYLNNNKGLSELIKQMPLGHIFTPISIDPLLSCEDFFSKISEARKIMSMTNYYIRQTDSFRSRELSFSLIFSVAIMIGLVLVVGVIFPLARSSVSNLYLLWIPFVFYGIIYFFVVYKLLRILMILKR